MVPITRPLRVLMWIVIAVSVPEAVGLLFAPPSLLPQFWIWGPPLNAMTARFVAGIYLSVAVGFGLALKTKETDWEKVRLPIAMLWTFALVALVSAVVSLATDPTGFIHLDRPFTFVWFFLYGVSIVGGVYYHVVHPRKYGAKPW